MSKLGRNDICPCGSGKKYKKCCINKEKLNIGKNQHWFKEDFKNLSTETIISRLKYYGVEFDKKEFIEGIKEYHSAQDITEHWFEIYNVTAEGYDEDFIWMAAWILCERYSEENIKCDEQLSDDIHEGYNLASNFREVEACDIWLEVWDYLKLRFKDNGYNDLEKVNQDYKGDVDLVSWVDDVAMYLHNAGKEVKDYFNKRIKFCQEVFTLLPQTSDDFIRELKRAEASSYFHLGQVDKGDEKFKQIINEYPHWAWGYIGWGDIYGIYKVVPDSKKAEKIYKMAFDVDLEDKENSLEYVEERLLNLD